MDSLKPSKRQPDGTNNIEQLINNLSPLLTNVLPDLKNLLNTDSANNESGGFNLEKLMDMLPTLMVLLPGFINSMSDTTGTKKAQLQDSLSNLKWPTASNSASNNGFKEQATKALPVLIEALLELTDNNSSEDLTRQLKQLSSTLKNGEK